MPTSIALILSLHLLLHLNVILLPYFMLSSVILFYFIKIKQYKAPRYRSSRQRDMHHYHVFQSRWAEIHQWDSLKRVSCLLFSPSVTWHYERSKQEALKNANLQKTTPKEKVKYNVICHYSHKVTK